MEFRPLTFSTAKVRSYWLLFSLELRVTELGSGCSRYLMMMQVAGDGDMNELGWFGFLDRGGRTMVMFAGDRQRGE